MHVGVLSNQAHLRDQHGPELGFLARGPRLDGRPAGSSVLRPSAGRGLCAFRTVLSSGGPLEYLRLDIPGRGSARAVGFSVGFGLGRIRRPVERPLRGRRQLARGRPQAVGRVAVLGTLGFGVLAFAIGVCVLVFSILVLIGRQICTDFSGIPRAHSRIPRAHSVIFRLSNVVGHSREFAEGTADDAGQIDNGRLLFLLRCTSIARHWGIGPTKRCQTRRHRRRYPRKGRVRRRRGGEANAYLRRKGKRSRQTDV